MRKMRVYEYAKEKNISSKEIIEKLKSLNIEVTNHMSVITEDTIKKLEGPVKETPKQNQEKKDQPVKSVKKNEATQRPAKKPFQNKAVANKPAFTKKNDRKRNKNNNSTVPQQEEKKVIVKPMPTKIVYSGSVTLGELAKKLHKEPSELIKKLLLLGAMTTINQELDKDSIELIASDYGVEVEEEIILEETDFERYEEIEDPKDIKVRPPGKSVV